VQRRTRWIAAGALAVAAIGGGTGIAVASGGGNDSQPPISGADLQKASAVALEQTGGGRVTASEVGDEQGYYEVEVTLDNGNQVDVHLNRDFSVINAEADHGGQNEGPNSE
jgi:hypothetical protein